MNCPGRPRRFPPYLKPADDAAGRRQSVARRSRSSMAAVAVLALTAGGCRPLVVGLPPVLADAAAGAAVAGQPASVTQRTAAPLPRGIRVSSGRRTPDLTVDTYTVVSAAEPEFAIARRYLAVEELWPGGPVDPSRINSADDVESVLIELPDIEVPAGGRIVPLDAVRLPGTVGPVGGLYPWNTGYPLVEWTVLLPERADGGEGRHAVGDEIVRTAAGDTDGSAAHPYAGRGRPSRREERLDGEFRSWLALEAARLLAGEVAANPDPRVVRVMAVGDIMPGRGFGELLISDADDAVGDTAPLLKSADLLIGNLETTVTDHDTPVPKSYNFRVGADVLEAVTRLGFDFYHLANNHNWDYGERGFLDTLENLRNSGAGFSGAGEDLDRARFAWESTFADGQRVRILSLGAYYTERNGFNGAVAAAAAPGKPGVLWDAPENERFIRDVLAGEEAFTIVTVHGGYEWEDEPRADVMEIYRRYVDWGADLVLAHHPHVLQGMELYNGVPIAYSLGNFIFPGMRGWYTAEESGALEFLVLNGRIVGAVFHPVRIDDVRIRPDRDGEILRRFWKMTSGLNALPVSP